MRFGIGRSGDGVEALPRQSADHLLAPRLVLVLSYFTEDTVDPIAVVAGLVQTGLYIDFFYIYFTKVLRGQKVRSPVSFCGN